MAIRGTRFHSLAFYGTELDALGKTLNLDLCLEASEKTVGPFRADILCKDQNSERWVLIENQLESSDHCHLGQILTYSAIPSSVLNREDHSKKTSKID